ncbi:MAG: PadR family transcriptional regulator [Candidatus Ranarchaeia archaeon]
MLWRGRGFGRGFWSNSISPIEFLILESLKKKPKHGYDLIKEFKKTFQFSWKPKPGTIYPILSRLNKKEMIIQLEKVEKQRKIYELTDKGEEVLKEIAEHFEKEVQFFNKIEGFVTPYVMKCKQTHHSSVEHFLNKISYFISQINLLTSKSPPSRQKEILKRMSELKLKIKEIETSIKTSQNKVYQKIDIE